MKLSGQSKVVGGNHLAAFLGHPDHFVRPHCHVLHYARTGARNWEGKSAQDIFRPGACAGSDRGNAELLKAIRQILSIGFLLPKETVRQLNCRK
jgi:hypothetical protein